MIPYFSYLALLGMLKWSPQYNLYSMHEAHPPHPRNLNHLTSVHSFRDLIPATLAARSRLTGMTQSLPLSKTLGCSGKINYPSCNCLAAIIIPRCYFPKEVQILSTQLHGFSDTSEAAYAGVVYLRMVDTDGKVHISLVASKTKVAPIKQLTIPRLELCGSQLLANLLHYVQGVLHVAPGDIFTWTDSTIVLAWLTGNPRRFVGNRISIYHAWNSSLSLDGIMSVD